jgi:UDP-glucose 4-epimerase
MSSTPQTWLITGGAGYIGAHIADEFLSNGKKVVIYDSLYQGLESRIQYLRIKHDTHIPLIIADIRDLATFEQTLKEHNIYGIIHTAALKAVAESVEKPDEYMDVNFHATVAILEIAKSNKIKNFIFASTAAVYGSPDSTELIKESDPTNPVSPYGESKLLAEGAVNEFLSIPGNKGSSLRFFNVIGTASQDLLDNSRENLVPIVINALQLNQSPTIFGGDYPTPDGTCIRDYVDVRDIARAHLKVADSQIPLPQALNIGTGRGYSVLEVVNTIAKDEPTKVMPIISGRRSGDSSRLCADVSLARTALDFGTGFLFEEGIDSLSR